MNNKNEAVSEETASRTQKVAETATFFARTTGFEPAISAVTGQRFKPAKLRPHIT